jgi:hypothetical protein
LTITNAKGQVVKTISLGNRGAGQATVDISMLAAGTYNYALFVDGRQVDNKRTGRSTLKRIQDLGFLEPI